MCVTINHYSTVNITQRNGSGKQYPSTGCTQPYYIKIIQTCDLPVSTLFVMRVVHVLFSEVGLALGCNGRNAQGT